MKPQHERKKKLTIVEIAREAGTSISTVSYAINNGPRPVSAETRRKIQAIIDRHAYAPNRIARSLKRRQTMSVGVIFPEMTNIYFPETLGGILEVTQDKKYNVILRSASGDPDCQEECIGDLIADGVDGLIIRPVERSAVPRSLAACSVPLVVVDRRQGQWRKYSSVYVDNRKAIEMAVGLLRQQGHSRIAMINGPPDSSSALERAAGYRHALGSEGILLHGDYSQGNGYESAKVLLARHPRVTAVITASTRITLGALQRFRDERVGIPADIALVAYGYSKWFSLFSPPITTVEQPVREMGRRAANAILAAIGGGQTGAVDESVDPIVVDGMTHSKHQ